MNSEFKADICELLSDGNISWHKLKDATVMITGATGLLGGLLIRTLSVANVEYRLGMRLIAHGRRIDKIHIIEEELGAEIVVGDICEPSLFANITGSIDYIFHCAAITSSADMLTKPVNVIATNVDGTRNVVELARLKNCKGFVYLSSMEIYGQTELSKVTESDLGYLDLSNPRNSYPESKRLCEMLCIAYATQYGFPAKIVRLARVLGAGVSYDDSDMRVAFQFARKAFSGEDIELHTSGNSITNCCYAADAVRGMLLVLFKGEVGQAYNVVNSNASATVRGMAELVANEVCGGKIKVVVNVPKDLKKRGYAHDVGYTISSDKLKALGWMPRYGLKEMYQRMLEDWRG